MTMTRLMSGQGKKSVLRELGWKKQTVKRLILICLSPGWTQPGKLQMSVSKINVTVPPYKHIYFCQPQ